MTEQLDDSDGRGRPTIEVGAPAELARRVRARIEAIARRAVDRRGRFAFAIPGGSVAQEFLPALSVAAIDWGATDVFWTDERWVPADSPDSNFGQARRLLFGAGPAAAARCHRIRTDGPDTEAAAAAERELIAVAGDRGRLDLILLGVGEDGHVCSLFPGRAELEETNRFVVPVVDAPKPPPRRISLTLPVLAAADHLWIGAFGATKADAVRGALTDPADPRPVARAVRAGRRVTMWLNQAAVGSIDTTPRAGLSEWGG